MLADGGPAAGGRQPADLRDVGWDAFFGFNFFSYEPEILTECYIGYSLSQVMVNTVSVNYNTVLFRKFYMIYYLQSCLASTTEFL